MGPLVIRVTSAVATWGVATTDGLLYTTIAAALAAGKTLWPNLDPGMQPSAVEISCDNGSFSAGSNFYYTRNKDHTFSDLASESLRDALADENYGGGQKEVLPGVNLQLGQYERTNNFWLRKKVASDIPILVAILG